MNIITYFTFWNQNRHRILNVKYYRVFYQLINLFISGHKDPQKETQTYISYVWA